MKKASNSLVTRCMIVAGRRIRSYWIITAVSASALVLTVLSSHSLGQDFEALTADNYLTLYETSTIEEMSQPVSHWLQNRRTATETLTTRLANANRETNIRLRYDDLLKRRFEGGDTADKQMLKTDVGTFSRVLLQLEPKQPPRKDIVDAMRLIDGLDLQLLEATKTQTAATTDTTALNTWSSYRASFALNFASLFSVFESSSKIPVNIPIEVRTVNPFTHAQKKWL